MIYKSARLISAIFSPLLIPTYAMALAVWLSVLAILPLSLKLGLTGIVFLITAGIPAVGIMTLLRTGHVSDAGLNNRKERTVPYIIVTACYFVCALFLFRAGAPQWIPLFFIGAGVASVISIVVNRWWKISAHAAAMGGLVAMLLRMVSLGQSIYPMEWWITGAILATGLVMSARVYMHRHTLGQVIAGAANGILCVWLISGIG